MNAILEMFLTDARYLRVKASQERRELLWQQIEEADARGDHKELSRLKAKLVEMLLWMNSEIESFNQDLKKLTSSNN